MNNTGFELLFCLLLFGAAIWLIDRVRNTERTPPQGMTPANRRPRGGANRFCPTCGYDGNAPAASTCSACQASLVEPAPSGSKDEPLPEQRHVEWLLDELRSESIWADLSDDQRMRIRAHYAARLTQEGRSVAPSLPATDAAPPAVPTTQPLVVRRPARDPFIPVSAATTVDADRPAPQRTIAADPPPPPREPRAKPWESWDPAVTLLYLGAFLVVSSGLFYASFNWSAFSDAARIGLLGGATLAFLAGGLALLPFQRVRPAAVTFVGIGALLVPMNVLAAWNILSGAASRPALTLALGATTTGILYAALSYRPGGIVYRYGTVVAGAITAFSLPPALGTDWRWGAILVTLLSAAALDSPRLLRGRRRRFATPATHAGIAAAIVGPLAVLGLTDDMTETSFTHAALFAVLTIVLWRFAQRRESPGLAIGAVIAATWAPFSFALDADAHDRAHAAVAATFGALAIVLQSRGPMLLRSDGLRSLLSAYSPAMFAIAVAIATLNDESALAIVVSASAASGMIALSRLWLHPGWLYAAIAFATAGWLELESTISHDLDDEQRGVATLGLWAVLLAVAAGAVCRRLGERWAVPLFSASGVFAALATAIAAIDLWINGQTTERTLTLTVVSAVFVAGSWLAGTQTRTHLASIPLAIWAQIALWAPMFLLPVGEERLWPLLTIASAVLLLLGAIVQRRFRPVVLGEALIPAGIVAAAGCAPVLLMVQLTTRYVLGFSLDDAWQGSWWIPYLVFYAGSAAIGGAIGLTSRRSGLALPVTSLLVVSVSLLLRMSLDDRALEVWTWLPAIVAASAIIAGLAWLVRTPANGFRDALGFQIAAISGGAGSIALFAMLIAAWSYVISGSAISAQLSDGARPWWTYLATFTLGATLAIVLGWFTQRREVAPVATVLLVSSIALASRMALSGRDVDVWNWIPLVAIISAAGALGALRLVGHNPFATAFAYQVSGIGSVAGSVAWLMSIGAIVLYIVDRRRPYIFAHSVDSLWWLRYEAMLLVTIAGSWVAGRRRRSLDLLAIPLTVSCTLAIVLALRMLTVDLTVWMWAGLLVGVVLWARWLRAWVPADHTFDRAVARMFDGLGVVTIVATIGLNAWLVWTDDTDAWSGVIVWATIAAVIEATARSRSWARLVYAAIAGGWIALGFMVYALDLTLADGGVLFAGYAWVLALAGVTIARQSGARVYAEIFERGAIAVALSPIALALTVPDAWEPGTTVYTRLTLAVLSLAGIVTLGAVVRRDAIRGIAASAIAMVGVMMQITAQEPANIQAFTIPLGLYALALGWFRRRHGPTFDGLTIAAAVLLIGPPLLDSFGDGGFVWWLVAGGIALGFVAYGIVLAHRTPLAVGIVGVTILVGRQLFDAVNALPTWIVLGLAGVALLAIGTVWLGFREALTNAFGRFRVTWGRLR